MSKQTSSNKRKSPKRTSSNKKRSPKHASPSKRKSPKRKSSKRKSPKRKSTKRKSPTRKSPSAKPVKTKYCSKGLKSAGKCYILKGIIVNYTYMKNGFKRIVSKSFIFKTSKERDAYISYIKQKYPTNFKIKKYNTNYIALRK
jgi:hypothetical protein